MPGTGAGPYRTAPAIGSTTAIELGQRTQQFSPIDESSTLGQNVYRLTQTVRFSDERRAPELKIGGYLGRWYDRDDWIVFTRFKTPIASQLSLVMSGSYGETIGTNWVETGRHADKDGRLYAGVAWENASGLLVQPVLGVGSVSSERSDDLSGTLLDLLLDAALPISRGVDVRGYVQASGSARKRGLHDVRSRAGLQGRLGRRLSRRTVDAGATDPRGPQ